MLVICVNNNLSVIIDTICVEFSDLNSGCVIYAEGTRLLRQVYSYPL
jgi:hypothetical protein